MAYSIIVVLNLSLKPLEPMTRSRVSATRSRVSATASMRLVLLKKTTRTANFCRYPPDCTQDHKLKNPTAGDNRIQRLGEDTAQSTSCKPCKLPSDVRVPNPTKAAMNQLPRLRGARIAVTLEGHRAGGSMCSSEDAGVTRRLRVSFSNSSCLM